MKDYLSDYHERIISLYSDDNLTFRDATQSTMEHMLDFLFAERGSIMLLNENGNLVIEAATKKSIIGLEIPYNPESVAWTVMDTKEPLFVEDITKEDRFIKNMEKYAKDYFLTIPIFVKNEIAGVLNLSDKMVSLLFDKKDLERANGFLKMLEPIFMLHYNSAQSAVAPAAENSIFNTILHNIKRPLSSVKGNLEIVKMSQPANMVENQFVETAIASCENIDIIVNSVTDMEKFSTGSFVIEKTESDLCYLIDDLLSKFTAYAGFMNVKINCLCYTDNVKFVTDPRLFRRILGNLVIYSLRNLDSSIEGTISVNVTEEEESISLNVTNNGIVIDDDVIEAMFGNKPVPSDISPALLPLVYIRQATDILKGSVSVVSEYGKTEFKILLNDNS